MGQWRRLHRLGKTFRVGDTLEFKYGPSHSVDVVNEAGYDGCGDSSATENHSDGDTKIDLKTVARTKVFYLPYLWSLSRWHEASHYGRSLPFLSSHPRIAAAFRFCHSSSHNRR
ncbi:Phytocyanin domain [Arabidopsis suecica]|uniref:Phytocyanin domain n=1 Tax=Arabidopsis suecica TaxID=45249 RepID=A0A8T2AM26_ARASU|nr:Phytocyanin domain [Arabidopsis suecica]